MLPKQWTLAALALAAGFAGGAISTGLGTVFAQERTRQITAERFVVVDASGKKRGEFGLDGQGSLNLNLYNDQGRLLWSAPTRSGIFPISPSQ